MNRSKRPLSATLRKQMTKAIRTPQSGVTTPEMSLYCDEMTAKELKKKFPTSKVQKKASLLKVIKMHIAAKKAKSKRGVSKRTTPGDASLGNSPASVHPEGKRWIKTLTKQARAQRTVEAHRGRKK